MFTPRQFLQVIGIAMLLLAISAFIANSKAGQACLTASNISSILLNRAPNPTDGKTHVTYSFSEASIPNTTKQQLRTRLDNGIANLVQQV